MLGVNSPSTVSPVKRDSISSDRDPAENAKSFFTEGEINICREIYALKDRILHLGSQLKESLFARNKLPRDITYDEVTGDRVFMQLIADLVHLNAPDDMSTSIYGVVILDGVRYEAVTDFFLASEKNKPKFYEQLCCTKNFPAQVLVKLKNNRRKLIDKHDSLVKDIITGMNFEGTPKEQPKSASKKEVQERVNAAMVIKFLFFFHEPLIKNVNCIFSLMMSLNSLTKWTI